MANHFGLTVLEGKRGLKLTREKYAIINNKNSLCAFSRDIYADKEKRFYSDEWCKKQLQSCLENYDLNMNYFSLLNHDEFNIAIDNFLKKNKIFIEVFDLNLYENKSGYYIMVLDEYCQVYIGTTNNIKKRIRTHWSTSKSFDRLLFPMGAVNSSLLSIDSFRALDTTRIFAYTTKVLFDAEDEIMQQFPSQFVCNRMAGGRIEGGLTQAIAMMKKRKLK